MCSIFHNRTSDARHIYQFPKINWTFSNHLTKKKNCVYSLSHPYCTNIKISCTIKTSPLCKQCLIQTQWNDWLNAANCWRVCSFIRTNTLVCGWLCVCRRGKFCVQGWRADENCMGNVFSTGKFTNTGTYLKGANHSYYPKNFTRANSPTIGLDSLVVEKKRQWTMLLKNIMCC